MNRRWTADCPNCKTNQEVIKWDYSWVCQKCGQVFNFCPVCKVSSPA